MGDVLDATEASIRAATHLGPMDEGAVECLRALALKIDMVDEYMQELQAEAARNKTKPPAQDNVSIPTYLKFCDALGLVPAGRVRLDAAKGESGGSKLGNLRSIHGGKPA